MLYITPKGVNTALGPFLSTSQKGEKKSKEKYLESFIVFSIPIKVNLFIHLHTNHQHVYVTRYLLGWRSDHSQPGFQA